MGLYILYFYVALYAVQECHMSETLAPYTIAIANAGAAIGRLGPNFLADKSGPLNFYLPFILVTGVLAFCWMAVHSSAGLIVFSMIYGFCSASLISLLGPITVELSTDSSDVIGTRLGMALASGGVGLLIGILLEFGHGCRIDLLSMWEELPKCPVSFMQWAVFAMQTAGGASFSNRFPLQGLF